MTGITSGSMNVEKENTCTILMKILMSIVTVENSISILQKLKIEPPCDLTILFLNKHY